MNFDKYTIKSQEALQKATEIALSNEQQAIEPGHILSAILKSDENLVSFLLNKLGIQRKGFEDKLEEIISSYPKVQGQQPYLSNDAHQALTKADKYLKEFKDEFIAVEHLILGILSGKDKVSTLMKAEGFVEKDLVKAIKELSTEEGIERAVRENYYMKKPNEDIFIIEYEDSIAKQDKDE